MSFEYSIKISESLKFFMPALSHFLTSNWYFASYAYADLFLVGDILD